VNVNATYEAGVGDLEYCTEGNAAAGDRLESVGLQVL
jgi:hypothetical protein